MLYKNVDAAELAIDKRELSRRLSLPTELCVANDSRYQKLISSVTPSYAAERVPIRQAEGGVLIGNIFAKSEALMRVARGCEECFIMVCTLGLGVDKLIAKESHLSVTDAFFTDAMADALIEALCDHAEREICASLVACPRFSPGYSDLPLEVGRGIVKALGAEVRQGIKFTDSGMMIPRKSVSAIICIKDSAEE